MVLKEGGGRGRWLCNDVVGGGSVREARRGFTLVYNKELYYIIFNETCDIISCATRLPDKE